MKLKIIMIASVLSIFLLFYFLDPVMKVGYEDCPSKQSKSGVYRNPDGSFNGLVTGVGGRTTMSTYTMVFLNGGHLDIENTNGYCSIIIGYYR